MPFAGLVNLVLPTLIIVGFLLALAWLVDRKSSFYSRQVDLERSAQRFHPIDGMRGFLAVFVMLHHCVISYFYYLTGQWTTPPSRLATLFGQGGVAMFFMVTALLFWHRALLSEGRLDLRRFFWSRLTRMTPMYVVAVLALIIAACAFTHFRMNTGIVQFVKDCSAWLLFTFPGRPNINGLANTGLLNTVFWTLIFEWQFYFIFPLFLFFARGIAPFVLLVLATILIYWHSAARGVEIYFVLGAATATLLFKFPEVKRFVSGTAGSVAIIVLLYLIHKLTPMAYNFRGAVLFFLIFLIVASGNSFFGLLTSRPARMLGMVSYSIYLSHNFVLYLVFRLVNHFTDVASLSVPVYWSITAAIAIVTVGLSALTYRYIEYPFMRVRMPGSSVVPPNPAASHP